MVRQSGLHRRCNTKGLMNANEIVESHVDRDSRFQVVQLFAKRVGQSRKTPKAHSYGQKSDSNRWNQAIEDARDTINKCERKIESMKAAIQTFKEAIEDGAPWPIE